MQPESRSALLVPGLGHAVMLETEWQRAAQALLDWLEETGL
jgi:hypothetical protein